MQRISGIITKRINLGASDEFWTNDIEDDCQKFAHIDNRHTSDPNRHWKDADTMKKAVKYGNDLMPQEGDYNR